MKQLSLILIFVSFFCLVTTVSWSVEEKKKGVITIRSNEFSDFKRSPVKFNHENHEKKYLCKECHHNNDIFPDNKNRKGAECSSCHKVDKSKEVPVTLIDAFHNQCKGCHEKNIKWDRDAGPVMCGSCHKKSDCR